MDIPKLGRVPDLTSSDSLTIKATSSGITVLKDGQFRKRYTGNKYSAVDINGQLWLRASELQKEIKLAAIRSKIGNAGGNWALQQWDGKLPAKKKARVETPAGNKLTNVNSMQISVNLSTYRPAPLVNINQFSTQKPPKKQREYQVNKKEVRQRILGYLNTQKGKKELYFWTVSFFPEISDDVAYRAFNTWLTALRQYGLLKDYIWIAERQDGKRNNYEHATNTVHFHIAIPHWMDAKKANAMMAGTLKNLAKKKELNVSVYRCRRYNGVHIAKNKDTKRVVNFAIKKGSRALANYLTKYITKNDGSFTHLAWHNSRGYSSLFTGVTFTLPEFEQYGYDQLLDPMKCFETDFFAFIPWNTGPPLAIRQHLYELNSYLQTVLN